MTHPPATVVRQILLNANIVRLPTDAASVPPCYVGQLPDTPHAPATSVCVYDTPGVADDRLLRGEIVDYPGIQIRVQSQDYSTGWALAESIRSIVDGVLLADVTLGSSTYNVHSLRRTSPIFSIGNASGTKRMEVFTLNLLCTMREQES